MRARRAITHICCMVYVLGAHVLSLYHYFDYFAVRTQQIIVFSCAYLLCFITSHGRYGGGFYGGLYGAALVGAAMSPLVVAPPPVVVRQPIVVIQQVRPQLCLLASFVHFIWSQTCVCFVLLRLLAISANTSSPTAPCTWNAARQRHSSAR